MTYVCQECAEDANILKNPWLFIEYCNGLWLLREE